MYNRSSDDLAPDGMLRRGLESSVPITSGYLVEYGLNWMALTGAVTGKETLQRWSAFDPMRDNAGTRWVIYVDPYADLSELTAAIIAKLHEVTRPIVQALAQKGRLDVAWACDSLINDSFVATWRAYVGADPNYPSQNHHERDLHGACLAAGVGDNGFVALQGELLRTVYQNGPHGLVGSDLACYRGVDRRRLT